jgi:hypothetical protein
MSLESAARAGFLADDVALGRGTFDERPAEENAWGGDPLGETERTIMRLRVAHPLLREG